MQVKTILNRVYKDLYAKLTLHSLTALKMASKCSATKCKLRFLDHFCLVRKHNSSFAVASSGTLSSRVRRGQTSGAATRQWVLGYAPILLLMAETTASLEVASTFSNNPSFS